MYEEMMCKDQTLGEKVEATDSIVHRRLTQSRRVVDKDGLFSISVSLYDESSLKLRGGGPHIS